jgi:chromosome segregation ATPase
MLTLSYQENEKLSKKCNDLESNKAALENDVARLKSEIALKESALVSSLEENEKAKIAIENLKAQVLDLEKILRERDAELQNCRNEIAKLKNDLFKFLRLSLLKELYHECIRSKVYRKESSSAVEE